ncbi:MAG: SgcJ/EcaC family oxidoreductase [Gemmatimonadota bacterium]|nr:MAG: SgcJ/EcaC family oxidoreductase [Gemmatimonadota bacterium]
MMRRLVPLICGALLALNSPALAQHHTDADAAIRAGSQQWAAAWNAGDAAALAALYAEDAAVMAPGAEPATGRAAIAKHFESSLKTASGGQDKIETLQVMVAGDWAVEVGKFAATAADGSHVDHGPYIAVWKKVDDKWMLYRDIWNSSMSQ